MMEHTCMKRESCTACKHTNACNYSFEAKFSMRGRGCTVVINESLILSKFLHLQMDTSRCGLDHSSVIVHGKPDSTTGMHPEQYCVQHKCRQCSTTGTYEPPSISKGMAQSWRCTPSYPQVITTEYCYNYHSNEHWYSFMSSPSLTSPPPLWDITLEKIQKRKQLHSPELDYRSSCEKAPQLLKSCTREVWNTLQHMVPQLKTICHLP